MDAVVKARARQRPAQIDATVAAFRESLYGEFDPVFNACWGKLYASLGDEKSTPEPMAKSGASDGAVTPSDAPFASYPFAVDQELAMAADDRATRRDQERRTIEFRTGSLREILCHGGSDMWYDADANGVVSRYTYNSATADDYDNPSGPHRIPIVPDLNNLIEPDLARILDWVRSTFGLSKSAAEQVCRSLPEQY